MRRASLARERNMLVHQVAKSLGHAEDTVPLPDNSKVCFVTAAFCNACAFEKRKQKFLRPRAAPSMLVHHFATPLDHAEDAVPLPDNRKVRLITVAEEKSSTQSPCTFSAC